MNNKGYVFLLVLLVSVAGCGKKKTQKVSGSRAEVMSNVDIPVADDGIRSYFDEELGEFALADEEGRVDAANNDFAWEEDQATQKYKVVYFDFDRYSIRPDQERVVADNINQIKKSIKQAQDRGEKPVVIIEGHACSSAGSAVYNLALSEKRAKVLADSIVAAGIPEDVVKIVGRGKEVPAILNGRVISGDKAEQWPNRRDEIRVMFS